MGAFADYRSVISRVGWVEQVHGRGLQQFDGRVGCLQWPPFREGLADREADSSFSLAWWPLQQVDPSLPNYKTPTTQNMHMWALRGCMPVSPSIDPSQINHGNVVYGGQMQFEQTLRINILCEARLSKYQWGVHWRRHLIQFRLHTRSNLLPIFFDSHRCAYPEICNLEFDSESR